MPHKKGGQGWETGGKKKGDANMIKKTSKGYQVVSKKGKPLSKPNLTKKEAEERLREIEYFKHKKR